MSRVQVALFLATITFFIAGCASRGEIETMKRQLNYLESSSSQMQDRMAQLDSMFRATVDKNVAYQVDLKTALADLIDKGNVIDGRLSDMEKRIGTIFDRMNLPVSPQYPTSASSTDTTHGTPAEETGLPKVDPNKLFNNAFTDLKTGNYDLAVMEFSEFLNLFKDNPQADDAQYWLGECYYGKKEYAKAIPEFEKVEKNYPNGDKLVPAIYKLGRSYEESGNRTKARSIFERIVKDFPSSFEAKPAQDKVRELQ